MKIKYNISVYLLFCLYCYQHKEAYNWIDRYLKNSLNK